MDKKELVGIYTSEETAEDIIESKRPKAKIVRKYLDMPPI